MYIGCSCSCSSSPQCHRAWIHRYRRGHVLPLLRCQHKKVHAMNGSGRSSQNGTLEQMRKDLKIADGESGQIPMDSVHAVTVPGAAAGWVDCVERFGSGKLKLSEILEPAAELAEKGFPVSELSATFVRIFASLGLNHGGGSRHQASTPCFPNHRNYPY